MAKVVIIHVAGEDPILAEVLFFDYLADDVFPRLFFWAILPSGHVSFPFLSPGGNDLEIPWPSTFCRTLRA